jgi:hypothetical protein
MHPSRGKVTDRDATLAWQTMRYPYRLDTHGGAIRQPGGPGRPNGEAT